MAEISNDTLERLREAARRAAANAYAPYSGFPVGAAVLGADGAVYSGCNVENAAFGLTQCAERAALSTAIAAGAAPRSLTVLLIYMPGKHAHPPCGACRQVMQELMAPGGTVFSSCDGSELRSWSHSQHLPDPFLPEVLLGAEGDRP